jgi:hypothetical protein
MLRGSAVAIVMATFVAAGAVGAAAIRNKAEGRSQRSAAGTAAAPGTDSVTQAAKDTPRDSATDRPTVFQSKPVSSPAAAPVTAAPVATVARTPDRQRPTLIPVVPAGQSDLESGVTAVRGDTDVVVAFDTPMMRTRRPEKFEQFVRTTLPLVYGSAVRNVLARIPDGTISGQGELLTELPKRGVRIPLDGAWSIRLYPETRPGQDGPLVIRYRVTVVPTTE